MHKAILSEHERLVLTSFLKNGVFNEKDRMIKSRLKRYYPTIKKDCELLKKAFEKFQF
jgi:hypothetical protein